MSQRLTDSELLAFAGLARISFRLDGAFTAAERGALIDVSRDLLLQEDVAPGPYRTPPVVGPAPVADVAEEIWRFIERAADELPDEESAQEAALLVTDDDSRQRIFDALVAIAASDAISEGEWSMLEWLETAWEVSRRA